MTEKTQAQEAQKKCSKCGFSCPQAEAAEHFNINRATKDGFEHWCKECKRKQAKRRREAKLVESKRPEKTRISRGNGNGRKAGIRKYTRKSGGARAGDINHSTSLETAPVTPDALFRAVRLSHAEEACRKIVEAFAPGYEVLIRPRPSA